MDPVVIVRPRVLRVRPAQTALALGALVVLVGLASLKLPRSSGITLFALFVAGLAALAVVLVRRARRGALELTDDGGVRYTGAWRTKTVFAPGEAGRAVRVTVASRALTAPVSLQLWLDADERARMSFTEPGWDLDELRSVRERLGLGLENYPDPVTPRAVRRSYPGSVPWVAAHPVFCTAVLIVVLGALVALA